MAQPKLKLYTYPQSKNAYKALIAAQYVGVDIEVPSGFQMGVTNKTPEFLKLNPNGKVGAGSCIFDVFGCLCLLVAHQRGCSASRQGIGGCDPYSFGWEAARSAGLTAAALALCALSSMPSNIVLSRHALSARRAVCTRACADWALSHDSSLHTSSCLTNDHPRRAGADAGDAGGRRVRVQRHCAVRGAPRRQGPLRHHAAGHGGPFLLSLKNAACTGNCRCWSSAGAGHRQV